MRAYEIDLSAAYTPDDVYDRMEEVIGMPKYFGRNLDALHDVWTDYTEETNIRFLNCEEADVMMSRYMRNLRRMAARAQEENPKLHVVFV